MLRLRGITLNTPDPESLAGFWRAALGYEARPLWQGYAGGSDPSGRDPHLTFQRSEGAHQLHVDLYADDPDVESARLVTLGAERLRRVEEGDTWWWVLRDPDGNEFCIIAAQGAGREL